MTGRRVVATGTFDILHPGHLYYLEESGKLGDELYVIVARDSNVKHKPRPIVPEEQRLRMVAALKPVDHALLGDRADMFRPIEEIRPAVITVGFNQMFREEQLRAELALRGLSPEIVRIGKLADGDLCSSRLIVQRVIEKRCHDQHHPE
ncbi:MAG TPA: adenylyltransferase/cytidyltransferase family protein [Methanoregula sp.]|nr:adenylyltransferase/cytidyltransferase family protein [Methanoregula sp.]